MYIYQYKDHLGNVRISYKRNAGGQLEVTDQNEYYPFGMNVPRGEKAIFGTASMYNYKYNGKELQETGMYDYGARMYMADIGRWGVVDNYSENYFSLSPYNYVAGNPIKFIDVNGEWIYINDQDGAQYRYSNGATQHQVNGKWANIDSSTKLSDYVTQTVAGLNYLDNNTSIGNTMIDYFDQEEGKDGKKRDINFNYTAGDSKVRHGISNIIDLNPSSGKGRWTTSGKDDIYSPLYSTIAHEMGHVYGNFALGETAESAVRFGDDSTTAEIYGTHVENIVRAETGLPLRTHYRTIIDGAGKLLPASSSRLIDNAGGSIYFKSNGSQLNPIPSITEVRNVNNTILQSRYNYYGAAAMYNWAKFKNRGQ
ncbi:RHS repeat-associated core domain-containing protein [Chryseobacterium sp. MIQD13]|uniref:RHS repeat-associated core domain-containing protein n=1 Tax=Chryseobacterium sp. MIQD13 TaxID=3422310 RepID=UPI003D28550A